MHVSPSHRRHLTRRQGFTLIELLLVIVIIATLAALVVPQFSGRSEEARRAAAKTQIESLFGMALDLYEADNGAYPSSEQSLEALWSQPGGTPEPRNWKGPYLKKRVPPDPWGNDYIYSCPGENNPNSYDLMSVGADGREGTDDDIVSWE